MLISFFLSELCKRCIFFLRILGGKTVEDLGRHNWGWRRALPHDTKKTSEFLFKYTQSQKANETPNGFKMVQHLCILHTESWLNMDSLNSLARFLQCLGMVIVALHRCLFREMSLLLSHMFHCWHVAIVSITKFSPLHLFFLIHFLGLIYACFCNFVLVKRKVQKKKKN